jgi:hypothetical protein
LSVISLLVYQGIIHLFWAETPKRMIISACALETKLAN